MSTSTIHTPRLALVAALAGAGILLSGCGGSGGGGGGGNSNVRDNPDSDVVIAGQLEAQGLVRDGERIDEQGQDATLVILDGGLDTSHQEFDGMDLHEASELNQIASTSVSDSGTSEPVEYAGAFDDNHGTAVTSIAAGRNIGAAPEATVLAYRMGQYSDSFAAALDLASDALQADVDSGDRPASTRPVMNFSGVTTGTMAENALEDFHAETGGMMVMSAGNNGGSNPEGLARFAGADIFNDSMIVVGALNSAGDDLASFSNKAGDASDYYLMAPGQSLREMREGFDEGIAIADGENEYAVGSGTSFAAPFVSGVAALVWSQNNAEHLSASDVAEILFETASTDDLEDYDPDVHGHGVVDAEAALAPIGDMDLSFAAANDDGSRDMTATGMTTGAAFGDAFEAAGGLSSVAAFDQFGRDFQFDLTGAVQGPRLSSLDRAMMRPHGFRSTESLETDGFSYTASYMDGGLESFQSEMNIGNVRLGVASRDSMELTPNDGPLDLVGAHRLLSAHTADAYQTEWYGAQGGHMGYDAGGIDLSVRHMVNQGSTDRFSIDHGDPQGSASRTLIRAGFEPTDDLNVGVTAGMVQDDERLFGTQGSGGFQMDGGNATQTVGIDMVYAMNDRVDLFARYEHGRTNTIRNSNSLVSQVDGLQTSSGSAGFVARATDQVRVGGVMAQPLRVESGTAELSIPVGRDLGGNVALAEESVDLSPSGRQTDYELFFDIEGQGDHSTRFNVMYSTEPGHVASNPSEWGAMVTHQRQF
ncbi:peptidase S8 and S53 subtilisin kexin sedolisin (plasmid) [Thioalkalivibrio sp. K90mix]|uniref:S8 family serine peptidase n=1 Tax=Thioalkalivibrio sp. (strain K90mix) TaxID=396595 RepID=UPI000195A5ED|nr:S8 family serine peptidase [Thioalkalivibrio sp. K90mix]ADC73238.1 peptidase S8 and S53 subtilisin kexin sedolisin [Thioalkalivibrio sp. K90mix]